MASRKRTRRHPGPRLAFLLALLVTATVSVQAHDPGLSSLTVTIGSDRTTGVLSVAMADVALVAADPANMFTALRQLAAERVALVTESQRLSPAVDRVWRDDDTVHASLSFQGLDAALVTVRSDVAAQLANGHRQLMTITDGRQVLVEKLLDAQSAAAVVTLASQPRWNDPARFLTLGLMVVAGAYCLKGRVAASSRA